MILSINEESIHEIKPKTNITELFRRARNEKTYVKICAPMVRYSKLQFRTLVRKFGVDLCFTPMIMADSFCKSSKARLNEFSTDLDDTPVIVQFAANNRLEYLSATEMIYPYVDGVDLNCGCPQRWAISTGYGCALLTDPEIIKDLTSTIKRNLPGDFSVSAKLRVQKPLSKTIDLCRQLERCGVTFLTVHGRTATQKISEPSNIEYLNEINKSISIPLIANGDVKTLNDADRLYEQIQCNGIMSARGILSNPGLFNGYLTTPIQCLQDWINIVHSANESAVTFQCFHHHLTFMMEKMMTRRMRVEFNNFTKKEPVYDFLERNFSIVPQTFDTVKMNSLIQYNYDETKHLNRVKMVNNHLENNVAYESEQTQGKYFMDCIKNSTNEEKFCDNGLDFMDSRLFEI